MRGVYKSSVAVLIVHSFLHYSAASNILLIPSGVEFNSRFINMLKIGQFLKDDGHDISMLLPSTLSDRVNSNITLFDIPIPDGLQMISIKELLDFTDRLLEMSFHEIVNVLINVEKPMCEIMLNSTLPVRLKESNFDLVIIDVFTACHKIIAEYLNTNVIQYTNYGHFADPYLFYPTIPSISCTQELGPLCTAGKPSFLNRLQRIVIVWVIHYISIPILLPVYEQLRSQYGYHTGRTLIDFNRETLVIANIDFALDNPTFLMPHVIPISGLFRENPQPLSEELDQFMKDAGENGVIVVSFGTMFDLKDAEVFFSAFTNVSQNVIWKYKGPKPQGSGKDVLTLPWIPQNDLLAHPATRLFITHCGIASTYEAAVHGVPVVAIPLNLDQPANAEKLVNRRKMGVALDIKTMTEHDLARAIDEVLTNPTYKENAKITQTLLNDKLVEPKDEFLYWVKYVIRHNGAKHLLHTYAHDMSVTEFWSLDVYFMLIFLLVVIFLSVTLLCYFVLNKICFNRNKITKQKIN